MKHIVKGPEPRKLRDWKALANEDWKPSFDDLRGDVKEATRLSLMDEQGHICCYCERRLRENDSHIEHFSPQSANEVDPLDYGNLLCSCQDRLTKGEPRHCGNAKGEWFDEELLVSPLDSDCEQRFAFTLDGRIKPVFEGDRAAIETIDRLALNIRKLDAYRFNAITPFLDDLTRKELEVFVKGYLEKDSEGKYGEFWTTIRQLFREYLPKADSK